MPFITFPPGDRHRDAEKLNWDDERREATRDLIDSIRQLASHLTRWERDFLDSIEWQLEEKGHLTDRQVDALENMHFQHGLSS